jgi:hypothetical protein
MFRENHQHLQRGMFDGFLQLPEKSACPLAHHQGRKWSA